MSKRAAPSTPAPASAAASPATSGASAARQGEPPDHAARRQIETDLDTTLLVEAAAGTGKTTSLVSRMVALIREGRCAIDTLAAVTFTRNAAAELRGRFQAALERAAESASGEARARLKQAVAHVDRCYLGTIHSFCARLLRERPVEAGVDLAFEELDDAADAHLRAQAWDEYVAALHADEAPILDELNDVGLDLGQLGGAFLAFAEYPDVPEWPAPEVTLPDLAATAKALEAYAAHMRQAVPPDLDAGNDKLIARFRRVARTVRQADLAQPAELMEVLTLFRENPGIVQRNWPGGKAQALDELNRWNTFCQNVAGPALRLWRAHRYAIVLRAIRPACALYDRHRREAGGLNFQDLLLKAAALLRDRPAIRRYFRNRFTHVLVDEFQDTDPIQAEVMLLLTAADVNESDWRRCRPVPGSLFVVGDPKQSIYRFRRADIVTYNQVRTIITDSGGRVLALSANFRSAAPLIDWFNRTFEGVFPAQNDRYAPAFVQMLCGRQAQPLGPAAAGVWSFMIPETCKNKAEIVEYESDRLAWAIHRAVREGPGGPCADEQASDRSERSSAAKPGDFLIVSRGKKGMTAYGDKLQRLGIPYEIIGGASLNEVPELALLHTCLRAATDPNNPVAVVAALRGPLFGISDPALYGFRRAGGRFSVHATMPEGFSGVEAAAIDDALRRLRLYERWLGEMPPVPAIERISADLGLMVRAAAAEGGAVRAGCLAKAFELLRAESARQPSLTALVAYLGTLVEPLQDGDRHDGMSTHAPDQQPVRIMNLHKVKGLEAPVVFLANPTGEIEHGVELHVDRSGQGPPRGYLAISGEGQGRSEGALLACLENWDELTAEEKRFRQAEAHRLYYVAATRAGAQLVVSGRPKNANWNPWQFFAGHLSDCPPFEAPQAAPEQTRAVLDVLAAEAETAARAIDARWEEVLKPSYAVLAAKESSLADAEFVPYRGERHPGWGTVIHELLRAAMEEPETDSTALAAALLEANDQPAERLDRALAMLRTVTRSDLWKRALKSPQRMVEVPFHQRVAAPGSGGEANAARLMRGIIDLVFWEPQGWVIVDFKTHEGPGGRKLTAPALSEYASRFRPQVLAYAGAWQQMTGQNVHEMGLYFIHSEAYVVLAPD